MHERLDADGTVPASRVGRYAWDSGTGEVWWSDAMFAIYGFAPREVVPSRELVAAHRHPDDVAQLDALVGALHGGTGDYSCWHRIVDARGRTRHVVSVGSVTTGDDGVSRVEGYVTDVSEPQRTHVESHVHESLARFRESAAVIEQAKGALMALRGIDADAAFEVLRETSTAEHVKLRDVARAVLGQRVDAGR